MTDSRAARPRRVTMKDVAAAAGVDASLVSRLLSGDESLSVRPETEQRVMDAVQRLGYRRNPAARALKTARTMALGLIIPDLRNVIYTEIAVGAEERAAAAGYVLLITGGSAHLRQEILEDRVDGILYGVATADSVPTLERARLAAGDADQPSRCSRGIERGRRRPGRRRHGHAIPDLDRAHLDRPHRGAAERRHCAAPPPRLHQCDGRGRAGHPRGVHRRVLVQRGGRRNRGRRAACS